MLISFLKCLSFWKLMGNCSTNCINIRQILKLSDFSQFSLIQIKPFTLTRQKLIDQKRVQLSISGKHNEHLISSNNNINIINPSTSDLWSWQTLKLDGNLNKINDRCETKNRQFVDEKSLEKVSNQPEKCWKNVEIWNAINQFFCSRPVFWIEGENRKIAGKIYANFISWKFRKSTLYLLVSSS